MRTIETDIHIEYIYILFVSRSFSYQLLEHFRFLFHHSFFYFFSGLHDGIYRTRITGLYTLTKDNHDVLSLTNEIHD